MSHVETIIKQDVNKPSVLSTYHLALNFVGYVSFYNALIEFYEESKNIKNISEFMSFANTVLLKDFAIIINEMYKYIESISPGILERICVEQPKFEEFLVFIKKVRNNMKFFPKRKIIDEILNSQSHKYPNNFGIKNKNDIVYYCGYLFGSNVVFGSNLYFEYVFYEARKLCKERGDLYFFTDNIIKSINVLFKVFEKTVFNDNINIPKIVLRDRKEFFQIYQQTTRFNKMLRKSKYDKHIIFIFMLIIEEIYSARVYFEYIFDMDKTIKDSYLLFFFSQYIAIKYDEIRDAIELLIKNGEKFSIDNVKLKKEINKLNVFRDDVKIFAGKLRNAHHCTEISKYILNNKDITIINLDELYLKIVGLENWPDDYTLMLSKMRNELNIILEFCRKNIGINY